jgi:GNAT superfamily N-acetyltransferase
MPASKAAVSEITLLTAPTLPQIQTAAEWLATYPHPNPDLEIALNLVLQGRIIPQETGELVVIALRATKSFAHTPSTTDGLSPNTIRGVVMASPGNTNVSLTSSDCTTATSLFALIQPRGYPRRIATSSPDSEWLRPLLLQADYLEREHYPLVMACTQPLGEGAGRWALPADKPRLQAYAEAYRAERGGGSLQPNWDTLIQQRQVAVLEHNDTLVAVVKCGTTCHHGVVVGTFTFPVFRQQGFACRLLAFFTRELLKDYPAVKLWVDEDNVGAIALYRSVGFQHTGSFYTGRFTDDVENFSPRSRF